MEKKNNKKRLPQKKDEEITNQLFGENSPTNESFEKQKEMLMTAQNLQQLKLLIFRKAQIHSKF